MYHIITGVYGDVQRVKILYNKKDSALIQMAEQHQAYLGEYNNNNNKNRQKNVEKYERRCKISGYEWQIGRNASQFEHFGI